MTEDHQEKAIWRVGRKLGRTIYAMVAEQPGPEDVFLGVMDSAEIAKAIVQAHNQTLVQRTS